MNLRNAKIIHDIKIAFERTILREIEDNAITEDENQFNDLLKRATMTALEQVSLLEIPKRKMKY